MDEVLRDYAVDVNELTDSGSRGLLHLLIGDDDISGLELVLSLPREGYKTVTKPDIELVDLKLGWTPLVTAINQGPTGS